ncbi:MAG: endonuclease/exonuclease/phosphatase family protein [Planctomycetota bacterium]
MKETKYIVILLLVFHWLSVPVLGQEANESGRIRVMSFNIRYGEARDGENHWVHRKETVIETIMNYLPDVLGTQETLEFQAQYLSENLADYTYVGRARQADGQGEHVGILFRTERFDKLIEGHFWLSENPDQPGSKSWDSSLPRMVTWLKLWDRKNGRSFYVVNTHFDHRGSQARAESAALIRAFVASLPEDAPVIIMGDFNAAIGSEPYRNLFGQREDSLAIADTFAETHADPDEQSGTFNHFRGENAGARIDWIGVTSEFSTIEADIDRFNLDGRYPSDHYPVNAEIEFADVDAPEESGR